MKNYILTSFISLLGFVWSAQADNTPFIISELAPVYQPDTPDTEAPLQFDYKAYRYNPYTVQQDILSIDDYLTILVLQFHEVPSSMAANRKLINYLYAAYQHPQRPHLHALKELVSQIAHAPAGESDSYVSSTLLGVLGRLPLDRVAHLRISNYLLHAINLELETNNAAMLHVSNFVAPEQSATYVSINYQKHNQHSHIWIEKLPLNIGIKYLLLYFIERYLADTKFKLENENYDSLYYALEKYNLLAIAPAQQKKLVEELLSLMKWIPLNEALLHPKLVQLRTLILGKRLLRITVDASVVAQFVRYFNQAPTDRLVATPAAINPSGLNWKHACPQGSKCTLLGSNTNESQQHARQTTHPAATRLSVSLARALGLL